MRLDIVDDEGLRTYAGGLPANDDQAARGERKTINRLLEVHDSGFDGHAIANQQFVVGTHTTQHKYHRQEGIRRTDIGCSFAIICARKDSQDLERILQNLEKDPFFRHNSTEEVVRRLFLSEAHICIKFA